MTLDNIIDGRNRAIEILNLINPDDAEILYGERYGGIGYCSFRFTYLGINYAATVRTSNKNYIKVDKRLLDTNRCAAEYRDIEHVLILGFNWDITKQIYLLKELDKFISHQTPGRRYLVFTKRYIDDVSSIGGIECVGNKSFRFL